MFNLAKSAHGGSTSNLSHHTIIGLGLNSQLSCDSPEFVNHMSLFLQTLGSEDTFVVVGNNGSAQSLVQHIHNSGLGSHLQVHYDNHHTHFDDNNRSLSTLCNHRPHEEKQLDASYVILATPDDDYMHLSRIVLTSTERPLKLVMPFAPVGQWSPKDFDSPEPLLFYMFPFTGTMRFYPPMQYLLGAFRKQEVMYQSLTKNSRFIDSIRTAQGYQLQDQGFFDNYLMTFIKGLEYHQFMLLHEQFSLRLLRYQPNLKVIVLLRDPRDMLISYYFREFIPQFGAVEISPAQKESLLLDLLDGFQNIRPNYFLRWPSIGELVDHFSEALDIPHFYWVRFEDLHTNALQTYRHLLQALGLETHPLVWVNDAILEDVISLGSFERQTQGQYVRGQADNPLTLSGDRISCRKGVPGDWQNHFTDRLKDAFKQKTRDALIYLGYEADDNW